jgi:hypothetical protein
MPKEDKIRTFQAANTATRQQTKGAAYICKILKS